jgi:hypothetical protein
MKADAETLAKALDWVNTRLREEPGLGKLKAVEEAAMKFDLGPLDEEWLVRQVSEREVASD